MRELFPDDGPRDALTPVLRAVRALEPKRARSALATAVGLAPATVTVLEQLIYLAEECCWPGGAGPGVYGGVRWEPGEPADADMLWWGEVVTRALIRRTQAAWATSSGDSDGAPTEDDRWTAAAREAGDPAGLVHVGLVRADELRRQGDPGAATVLVEAVTVDADALPGAAAARALLLGDLALTPISSPETLGSTLVRPLDLTVVRPEGLDEAERRYDEARAAFRGGGRESGVATAEVRLAFVARLRGQLDMAAQLLDSATARAWRADDRATGVLALVHRQLLRLAVGEATHRNDPSARIAAWVAEAGSPTWVQGCARVVLAAADRATDRGEVERALSTYAFAQQLLDASGLDDLHVSTGRVPLLLRLRSHGLAATTWEESYAAFPAEGAFDVEPWAWVSTSLVAMAAAMRMAGDVAGLDSVAGRARALLARGPDGGRDLVPSSDVLDRIGAPAPVGEDAVLSAARSLSDLVVGLPAVADLLRAEAAIAGGRASTAGSPLRRVAALEGRDDLVVRALVLLGRVYSARARAQAYIDRRSDIGVGLVAELWHLVGEHDRAQAVLDTAMAPISDPVWEPTWAEDELRARVALARGHDDEARSAAEAGTRRLDAWFAALTSDTFRISALDDVSTARLAEVLVLARTRIGDSEGAFRAADHLRSLALGALFGDPVTPETRRWRQARAEWNGAVDERRQAWREPEPVELARTAAALETAERRVEEAAEELPRETVRARREPAPVDVAAVAEALDHEAVLLHYTLTEHQLVIAVVTRGGVDLRLRDVEASTVSGLCTRLSAAWSLPGAVRGLADDLGTLLVGPVADLLGGDRRVLVVPCAPALGLPFAALPFAGTCPLEQAVVSQLPAASLVPRLAGRPRPVFDAPCLTVGNPPSVGFRDLPGAEAEAVLVGRSLGGRTLVGAAATEQRVRDELATRTPVAHLACHGTVHPDAPDLSALRLAGEERLTVAELVGIGLDVDLAVLSACSSGRGRITRAGDVVGLSRGLLAAGVRHAVTSLWDVEDAATCLTMADFTDHLARGKLGVAEALTHAQRGVRALTREEARDRYADLCARAGVEPGHDGGRRRSASSSFPLRPTAWAPFVHLGV
ncbi:CHAT domain-containing protein [Actinomycetospora sp. OC33-EN08]|uniref:CHAT domain-containing protein n=1 Tax=Actinomycetospora aurantiaca TaxID=3129233 RepID=A0ABU8MIG9_9PSEU